MNTLVIENTLFQKNKTWLYTWTSPDGQNWNQTDCIFCSQRWRISIQSAKTRPRADCGSDHELLIAKFRLKMKKVGKTTRPFRYDLNQIPKDYTVEVRNRFKGLDLIDRMPEQLWTGVHHFVQEAMIKASSDNHFAFLHFFFLRMVLISASCTVLQTSMHSYSGILSIRSNPLNLFLTSTV